MRTGTVETTWQQKMVGLSDYAAIISEVIFKFSEGHFLSSIGHLCGLCGDADGDRRNDMATKDGTLVGLAEYAAVGDSWIVPGAGGDDPA